MTALLRLDDRIEGALDPDTSIYWVQDGTYLDGTLYGSETVECRNAATGVTMWTKTTGITRAAGSSTVANWVIAWTTGDLGSLVAGDYVLEFSATRTSGSKPRKTQLGIKIIPQVS
jgi:hypothetical protein